MPIENCSRTASPRLTRRRMIAITAAAAGTALSAAAATRIARSAAAANSVTWRGVALGAEAKITLVHEDSGIAAEALRKCLAEISRLEDLFSIYRPSSAVSRLNRDGHLRHPDQDMIALTSLALAVGYQTNGAFDISVQPLWNLYANHFRSTSADPSGPSKSDIDQAIGLIDARNIGLSSYEIRFAKTGMAITFNGIAQGYIADRAAQLLKQNGFGNALIHLGETFGLGQAPGQEPWRAGVLDPSGSQDYAFHVPLTDLALATSAGQGYPFTSDGRHHHIFEPGTGRSGYRYRSVSVTDPSAAMADALSTAFTVMPKAQIAKLLSEHAAARAFIVDEDGSRFALPSRPA